MRAALLRARLPSFGAVWLGQLVSLIGSGLTRFGLGVWVFQQTGSVTNFTLIALFATLPGGAILPVAGALIDRWDRRRIMIVCNSISALVLLLLLILTSLNLLSIWVIYLAVTLLATVSIFQWVTFTASLPVMAPREQLGRASALVQMANAVAETIAPLLAGALLAFVSLGGLLALDLLSFLFTIGALLLVQIPRPPHSEEGARAAGSLWQEALYGWRYIRGRPGLLALLLYVTLMTFALGVTNVLLPPLVLSFTDERQLGLIVSVGAGGALVTSLVLAIWGGPRRRTRGVLAFGLLISLSMLLLSLAPSVPLLALGALLGLGGLPLISTCNQAIWFEQVEPDLQGRVGSIRMFISSSTLPTAYLLVGPLADRLFNPLLLPGGALAGSAGQLVGVGPGRGIALMLLGLSLVPLAATLAAALYPPLRNLESRPQGDTLHG